MGVFQKEGDSPLLVCVPHGGTLIPEDLRDGFNARGLAVADTDWWQRELYQDLLPDLTFVSSNVSRYVVDCNRSPDGSSLYPGRNTTGLCPLTDFDGRPIYRDGQEPNDAEIARRCREYHRPYHQAIEQQIARLRRLHGQILLFDGHSIRSELPFLFEGRLPLFNWGSAHGTTCAPDFVEVAARHSRSWRDAGDVVVDARFIGGWTVRHYGRPERGVHALQLEMAQRAYLEAEEPPWRRDQRSWGHRRDDLRGLLGQLRAALASMPQESTAPGEPT